MAKKSPCRCKSAECEECPEWIFTFADLVMLMMGFFVILWVLKPSPNPKAGAAADDDWLKVAAAIREAFGYIPKPASNDPVDIEMLLQKLKAMKVPMGPGMGGKTTLHQEGAVGSDPDVTTIRPGPQSVTGGRINFDAGDATLTTADARQLDQIAEQIRGHRNVVLVKGHAALDDVGDSGTPAQRLSLSLNRAEAVADYLTLHGVAPDMLRVQGCSTFEPVVEHEYTPAAQASNRRVEVQVTRALTDDFHTVSSSRLSATH